MRDPTRRRTLGLCLALGLWASAVEALIAQVHPTPQAPHVAPPAPIPARAPRVVGAAPRPKAADPLMADLAPHFSPRGKQGDGCAADLIRRANASKTTVRGIIYQFTREDIADGYIAAAKAGADVQIIMDVSMKTAKNSMAPRLKAGKVRVFFDPTHHITHDKYAVFDGRLAMTGSFNWSANAIQSNAENLCPVVDPAWVKAYSDNWELHRSHSEEMK